MSYDATHFEGGDDDKKSFEYDAKPRKMENGDISLPFSVSFVIKKLDNFIKE